ncbi:MAG TPA: lipid-binding SYLF domain-containing protein [Mesotoga prima]|uniref:lipid-binding SYLF domain-containing protein n=1 Tax=Mesotoga prima TaxID=1184387 RepID=UPI002BB952BC|nr:lipid-binding SYLF domain-containing protein [Mesotoga prima]HOP38172.1 lipid-binding SYLF domain-containing protein [Mesotoga prima]HPJ32717.1 lipid-binding SYLF domain-containing protein [Mesotoga prima]HPQ91862.1 lipid-binding SYLF domain-containing protein [Mesotoga prima]
MKKLILVVIMMASFSTFGASLPKERIQNALGVLQELTQTEDSGSFIELLSKSNGIVIYPEMVKAALGFGGQFGEGFLLKRAEDGRWYGPLFLKLYGISYGFQAGVQKSGLVFVIMNEKGIEGFLGNNVTLGGSASISAGPTGKTLSADTDYKLEAAIYSYSVSNGIFAGVSLGGSIIRQDSDTNREYYGLSLTPQEIIEKEAIGDDINELINFLESLIVRLN